METKEYFDIRNNSGEQLYSTNNLYDAYEKMKTFDSAEEGANIHYSTYVVNGTGHLDTVLFNSNGWSKYANEHFNLYDYEPVKNPKEVEGWYEFSREKPPLDKPIIVHEKFEDEYHIVNVISITDNEITITNTHGMKRKHWIIGAIDYWRKFETIKDCEERKIKELFEPKKDLVDHTYDIPQNNMSCGSSCSAFFQAPTTTHPYDKVEVPPFPPIGRW